MERTLFRAVSAEVMDNNVTQFEVRDDNEKPSGQPFMLDGTKTPAGVKAGKCKWSELQLDDDVLGLGLTPSTYVMAPAPQPLAKGSNFTIYLQPTKYQEAATAAGGEPKIEHWYRFHAPYERMSIVYSDDANANNVRTGKRYVGFHGKVVASGATLDLEIRRATAPTGVVVWDKLKGVDFASTDVDDTVFNEPELKGVSPLTAASKVGDVGAVFVEEGFAMSQLLVGPKIPIAG